MFAKPLLQVAAVPINESRSSNGDGFILVVVHVEVGPAAAHHGIHGGHRSRVLGRDSIEKIVLSFWFEV